MNIRNAINSQYNWTLFLDRDGVLNKRPGTSYVTHPSQFTWLPGSLEAMARLTKTFNHIIVVTNQQGIGKRMMTEEQLQSVHDSMLRDIYDAGGKADAIYYAGGLRYNDSFNRKPSEGMFIQAIKDFPDIDASMSIMVGDTFSDMLFGHRLGLHTVLIASSDLNLGIYRFLADYRFNDLAFFADFILK